MGLLATLRLWLASFAGLGFRERRDRLVEEARRRAELAGRIYQPKDRAHREILGDYPRYWIHISTKGPDGRLLIERVQTAWPLALTNIDNYGVQARLCNEVISAYKTLRERRSEAWGPKDTKVPRRGR